MRNGPSASMPPIACSTFSYECVFGVDESDGDLGRSEEASEYERGPSFEAAWKGRVSFLIIVQGCCHLSNARV